MLLRKRKSSKGSTRARFHYRRIMSGTGGFANDGAARTVFTVFDYFARPDSSVFSIRTVAAGYIIRIARLALFASASLVNCSDTKRKLGTPGANTR
jgi:hypothetical protein